MRAVESEGAVRLRVLVIDDEDFVRFTLAALLRGAGYEVEEARSVEDALGKVRRQKVPFHVIVTDIMMGEVDGFMFRDAVRRSHAALPIVFLTSLVDEDGGLTRRVLADVHSYFLSKSADRETLLGVIRHATHVYRCEQSLQRMAESTAHNMELASFVQRSVLPKWAHAGPRYRYGYFWRPFSKVSGDLVEWFPLGPEACLVVFGDISGHGTHAALAMMGVQIFLQQLLGGGLAAQDVRPHRILQELHAFFRRNLPGIAYMACLVAVWDFSRNEVRFHNAGWQDLFCFRAATGAPVALNPEKRGGVPVGLLPDARYRPEDDVVRTFPDDAVFMTCSDGVFDLTADAAGEQFVDKAFVERTMGALAAETAREKDVTELATDLFQSLADCGWPHAQDDVFAFALAKADGRDDRFVRAVKADAADVDRVAQEVSAWAQARFGPCALGFRLELLLGEHLTNIVRHGLDENVRRYETLMVFIAPVPGRDLLAVTTLDHGRPWDGARPLAEAGKEMDARLDALNAALAPGGRGLPIKRRLVAAARHRRLAGMNRNVFYVPLHADALFAEAPAP